MQNNLTRQALAQDVKREVLAELHNRNRPYNGYSMYPGQHQTYIDQSLVQAVKQEILWELQQEGNEEHPYRQQSPGRYRQGYPYHQLHQQSVGSYHDRAMIESVKQDVMAQIEMEQEAHGQRQAPYTRQRYPDPALVQAVKQEVMFDLQTPRD